MKSCHMQVVVAAFALCAVETSLAQNPADRPLPGQTPPVAKPKPAAKAPADRNLQPLPEPPPPPPGLELDPSLEPQVTIQPPQDAQKGVNPRNPRNPRSNPQR